MYKTIYKSNKKDVLENKRERKHDSQTFEFSIENTYHRMDDITGLTNSNYHRTQDIIGGLYHNDFNRLN
jgi:hypothetical protein